MAYSPLGGVVNQYNPFLAAASHNVNDNLLKASGFVSPFAASIRNAPTIANNSLSTGQNLPDPFSYEWGLPGIKDIQYSVGGGSDPLGAAKMAYVTGGSPQWGANAADVVGNLQRLNALAERFKGVEGVLSPNQLAMQRYHQKIGLYPMGEATMQALQYGGYGLGGAPQLYNEILQKWIDQDAVKKALGANYDRALNDLSYSPEKVQELTAPRIAQAFQLQSAAKDAKPSFAKQWGPAIAGLGLSFIPGMQTLGATIGKGLGLTGTAANVAGSALLQGGIGGLTAGITGGDIGRGILTGGVGGMVGAGLPAIPGFSDLPKILQGAVKGGVSSGLTGGNPITGALGGGIGGLGGMAFESAGLPSNWGQMLAKTLYGSYMKNQAAQRYRNMLAQRRSAFPQRRIG